MMVRVTPASSCSREARPELSWSVRSFRQAPQWSAERRAGFASPLPAPSQPSPTRGGEEEKGAAMVGCASRRSASLFLAHDLGPKTGRYFSGSCVCCSSFSWAWWLARLGCGCIAGTHLLVRPRVVKRSGGGGPPQRVRPEVAGPMTSSGRWRGRAAPELATRPAPLPPSFACCASCGWSPLPAVAGRDEERAAVFVFTSPRVRGEQ